MLRVQRLLVLILATALCAHALARENLRLALPDGWRAQDAAQVYAPSNESSAPNLRTERREGDALDAATLAHAVSEELLARDPDAEIGPVEAFGPTGSGRGAQFKLLYSEEGASRAGFVVVLVSPSGRTAGILYFSAPESGFAELLPLAHKAAAAAFWSSTSAPAITACDTLAAHPEDEGRPEGVAGVLYGNIDASAAEKACRESVAADPDEPRYAFQLARALYKSRRYAEVVQPLTFAVDRGHPVAHLLMATAFEEGLAFEKDLAKAYALRREAAEAGVPSAMLQVGSALARGVGVARDPKAGLNWYRKAAEAGSAQAMNEVGHAYDSGSGVPIDKKAATEWYRRSAEAGNPVGMYNLAVQYIQGEGVPRDDEQAMAWYRKAAMAGHADAMSEIGYLYDKGLGVPANKSTAAEWFRKAGEAGSSRGMFNYAVDLRNGYGVRQDHAAALVWFRRAEQAGDLDAAYAVAEILATGRGVPKDPTGAAASMMRALEAGYPLAHREMAGNSGPWGEAFRMELQKLLVRKGVYSGPVDGKFGPAVTRAIAALSRGKAP